MLKTALMVAVLGISIPALADEPVVLADAQMDTVVAGHHRHLYGVGSSGFSSQYGYGTFNFQFLSGTGTGG